MHVSVSALSHEGVLRGHNEDSLVVGPWTMCSTVARAPQTLLFPGDRPLLVAVADGLGGHPCGELASTIVAQELSRAEPPPADEEQLRALVDACNRAVYDEAARERARTGMGTTLAGLVLGEDSVLAYNVGDSRVYVYGDELTQVSIDDNPPLAPGETHTPVLTQMLGGHSGPQDVDTHVATLGRDGTSRFLVCTDGLSDVVPADTIGALLADHRGPQAAYALWKAAIDAGGPDNITLAVVEPVEAE